MAVLGPFLNIGTFCSSFNLLAKYGAKSRRPGFSWKLDQIVLNRRNLLIGQLLEWRACDFLWSGHNGRSAKYLKGHPVPQGSKASSRDRLGRLAIDQCDDRDEVQIR